MIDEFEGVDMAMEIAKPKPEKSDKDRFFDQWLDMQEKIRNEEVRLGNMYGQGYGAEAIAEKRQEITEMEALAATILAQYKAA